MRFPRQCYLVAGAVAVIAALALPAIPAFAQSAGAGTSAEFPDLVPVAAWTAVAVLLTLGVTTLGYLYKRANGLTRPLQAPPIDMYQGGEMHDDSRDAAGHALPGHVVAGHAAAQHDDATEQAKLLHGAEHDH